MMTEATTRTTLPDAEALAAMVEAATDWPWHSRMGDDIWDFAVAGAGFVRAHMVGPEKDRQANAALIALAPQLAQEVIRLTAVAEDAKRVAAETVAANAGLAAECARLTGALSDALAALNNGHLAVLRGFIETALAGNPADARAFLGAAP